MLKKRMILCLLMANDGLFYNSHTPADHLPHTFVEAFAAAYKELVKKTPPGT